MGRISRAFAHLGPALCVCYTEIFHLLTGHPTDFYILPMHLFPGSLFVFYWLHLWGFFLSISSFCSQFLDSQISSKEPSGAKIYLLSLSGLTAETANNRISVPSPLPALSYYPLHLTMGLLSDLKK